MSPDTEKQHNEIDALLGDLITFYTQEQLSAGDIFHPVRVPVETRPPAAAEETDPVELNAKKAARPDEVWRDAKTIQSFHEQICSCQKCPLGRTRTKFVFGTGNPQAKVMVIGEAPGADEDAQGEPFVGRAGQLLNKILEAIHFKREEVFICNILKCRPPNNRDPLPEEVDQCEPYLRKQIALINPAAILCVGRIAGQTLLKTTRTLGELRGNVHSYENIPMMITYHPAALLRNPNWKRPTWEDVQQFRALYDKLTGTQ